MSEPGRGGARPLATRPRTARDTRHQRAWYWYDWANSAYVTTVATVLFGPYLTAVAETAACPGLAEGAACTTNLVVLGLPVAPGSLVPYTITVSTILSAVVLIFVGAVADRSSRPTRLFAAFAWTGATAACAMVLVGGSDWQLGVGLFVLANLSLGGSLVVYDSLLCRIAGPDERDRVSSRGWALGYLGGGLLLVLNLGLLQLHDSLRLTRGDAVRLSLLSAGLWWAAFTLIPVLGLRDLRGTTATPPARSAGVVGGSLRQLSATFRELRAYPQTLLFLLAYLFYNDGIQTVIGAASLYGSRELRFAENQLVVVVLLVQFVAFGGALLFGRLAGRYGAQRVVLSSLGMWLTVVVLAYFVPQRALLVFVALSVLIGLVLGGSQALSRSLFSQLIPRGKEAEFFSLYQAMERGTSWLGTLTFGIVYQLTGSYRSAILALIAFFLVGGILLWRVRVAVGIRDAGNRVPEVV